MILKIAVSFLKPRRRDEPSVTASPSTVICTFRIRYNINTSSRKGLYEFFVDQIHITSLYSTLQAMLTTEIFSGV